MKQTIGEIQQCRSCPSWPIDRDRSQSVTGSSRRTFGRPLLQSQINRNSYSDYRLDRKGTSAMTELSAPTLSAPVNGSRSATTHASRIGHALPVGAAGFAWCSLALGLATIGVLSPAGAAIILPGTFFYGGIVQLLAGFFALAAGASFAAAFLTAYGAFWIGYSAIEVYVAPHIVASIVSSPANEIGRASCRERV